MSTTYHKINSLYKRDERGQFLIGEWSTPELKYLSDNEWEFTEKVDGTNIRIFFDGFKALPQNAVGYIGGRTDNAQIPPKLLQVLVAERVRMDDQLALAFPNATPDVPVVLYGEGYGAGIQKGGGLYGAEPRFVLFDVLVGSWWLSHTAVEDVATALGLDVVPVVDSGTLSDAISLVQGGFESQWPGVNPEGLVCRPVVPMFDRRGQRIITKVKRRDFD